jgi:hypothetical protein
MISHSPVSSVRRSPTRIYIGNTRVVLDTFACGPGKGNCSASFGSRSFLGRGLDIGAVGSGTLEPVVPS